MPTVATIPVGTRQDLHRPARSRLSRRRGLACFLRLAAGSAAGALAALLLLAGNAAAESPAAGATDPLLQAAAARGADSSPGTQTQPRQVRPPHTVRLGAATSGDLLIATDRPGEYRPAPLLGTDVQMDVSGMVARVAVVQRFYNPTEDWVEATYVFPLSDGAAVDAMRLIVGDRFIEGRIAERDEAKRLYDQAKSQGRRAALLDQERPNIFTNSVANIGPGEEVVVRIEYQETPRYDSGRFSIRFPMVVAPRFMPAPAAATTVRFDSGDGDTVGRAGGRAGGWADQVRAVPDADRIAAPVLPPAAGPVNPVLMTVRLDPGFDLSTLRSPSHEIAVEVAVNADGSPAEGQVVRFADGPQPADRDFVLEWTPKVGVAPKAGLFEEQVGDARYQLMMVLPPEVQADRDRSLPREVVFVIDTSGSMGGTSIDQARQALVFAMKRLLPTDRFNLIQFSNYASTLFPAPRPAKEPFLSTALNYAGRLRAGGGTDIYGALVAALDGGEQSNRVRQVVFLTDGNVGNDDKLMSVIHDRLGDSRLFTVGIGSAPNSWFMRKAAEHGRGTFTHIGNVSEVAERMTGLFAKLEHPVLTDIQVVWETADGLSTDGRSWPRIVPDLYRGEPVLLAAQPSADAVRAVVSGTFDGRPWESRIDLPSAGRIEPSPGVAKLWARRKIAGLMDGLARGRPKEAVRQEVLAVALEHHLVSKYTSLVAVDVEVARPANARMVAAAMPVNLPAGWDFGSVFGFEPTQRIRWREPLKDARAPGGATPGVRTAATTGENAQPPQPAQVLTSLPQGATPATLQMLIGVAMLLLAGSLLRWRPSGSRQIDLGAA